MAQGNSMRELSKDGSVHVTDEKINTIISATGAVLSLLAGGYLVTISSIHYKPWHLFSFTIYGFTLVNLFAISAMHHGVNASPRLEYMLRQFDFFSIFLFIAGCFTPVCLVLTRDAGGPLILAIIWMVAIVGITVKAMYPDIPKWVTNAMYVGMGWVGALCVVPVYHKIGWKGLLIFVIGGVLYTIGSFIYYFERPNPIPGKFGFHEIWHLFVFAAASSHCYFMLHYVLPFSLS